MESIIFGEPGKEERIGIVIGCETDYFWLLVISQNRLYVGHPSRVISSDGKKYFWIFDHYQSTDQIFNAQGEVDSYLISYSENPDAIKKHIKTYRLIGII